MDNDYNPVKINVPIVIEGQNCWQIGNHYITAQPTDPEGLTAASQLGIKSVICLRDATEAANPPYLAFDAGEDQTLISLGMSFVNIPVPHGIPQDQFNTRARAVLAVLSELPQPILMHCSSGDRASALWAIHLIVNRGLSNQDAVNYAKMSGLEVFIPYVQAYQA